ncbi:MAG: DUF4139 domain-containing protein [Flavobacteriales bacterium]|nr:DUF4139 domain-containing protein [Flavobacteriales bacterium]
MKSFLMASLLGLLANFGFAQLKTNNITIFKNGTAFIQKSGTVKTPANTYRWAKEMPQAVYGTFWFASPTGTIQMISSKQDSVSTPTEWVSFFDLLMANEGKKAEVFLKNLENATTKSIEGIIYETKKYVNGSVAVIKSGDKFHLIREDQIAWVAISGNLSTTYSETTTDNVISVKFKENKAEQKLDAMYLSTGFNWTPMYELKLLSETEAQIFLKASITNDAEKIENANMKLVVGSPSFYTTTQLSDLLGFAPYSPTFARFNNGSGFFNNSASFYDSDDSEAGNMQVGSEAEGVEDLYFFDLKNISIDKGERMHIPIFHDKTRIEHKYVCDLTANNAVNAYNQIFKYENSTLGVQTYHQIKMWNETDNPLTSGLIMVTKKVGETEQALATSKLEYTAKKNCSYITISNAPDIEIKEEEKEIQRTDKTKTFNNARYVEIKVQSTITVKSYKSTTAHMEIKRNIFGQLDDSDTKWETSQNANYSSFNASNNVKWTIDLEPGKEKKIVYTYSVYVRG